MSRSIQPWGRDGSAQASATSANAVSTRISNSRHERRSDFETTSPSSGSTPRRTGQNQYIGSPGVPDGIGKSPRRYAASRVPGARSAPIPTRSSRGSKPAGSPNVQRDGGGSIGGTTRP